MQGYGWLWEQPAENHTNHTCITEKTLFAPDFLFSSYLPSGGPYWRILTEVASTDRTQYSCTDRSNSVNKMFIIWPLANKKAKEQKHI